MKRQIRIFATFMLGATFCASTAIAQGVEDRTTLITHANTALPDNTSRAITPAGIRNLINSLTNSTYNKVTDVSVVFDTLETTYGLKPALYTTAEREAIDAADMQAGFLVYDTDESIFYFSDGEAWQAVGGGVSIGDAVGGGTGNRILYLDAAGNLTQHEWFFRSADGQQTLIGEFQLFPVSYGQAVINSVGTIFSTRGSSTLNGQLRAQSGSISHYYSDGSGGKEYVFPRDTGSVGQVLTIETNDAAGVNTLSWQTPSGGGISIGDDVAGGSYTNILYVDASGQLGQSDQFTFDDGTNTLTVGNGMEGSGGINLWNSTGDLRTTIEFADGGAGNTSFIIPNDNGSGGQVLSNDGTGVLSWESPTITGAANEVLYFSPTGELISDNNFTRGSSGRTIIRSSFGSFVDIDTAYTGLVNGNARSVVYIGFDDESGNSATFMGNYLKAAMRATSDLNERQYNLILAARDTASGGNSVYEGLTLSVESADTINSLIIKADTGSVGQVLTIDSVWVEGGTKGFATASWQPPLNYGCENLCTEWQSFTSQTLNTTPIDISGLPAPGAGKIIVPKFILFAIEAGVTDYDYTMGIDLVYASDPSTSVINLAPAWINSLTDSYNIAVSNSTGLAVNSKMQLSASVDATQGNGTFWVKVIYQEVTAPF